MPSMERPLVKSWDLRAAPLRPHSPSILASGDDARMVVLEIRAGESIQEHHGVLARTTARVLLPMTSWPGQAPSRDDLAQRKDDGGTEEGVSP